MVNVVYSSDNVTVLGGPARLDLDIDIGAEGQRGSRFFVNSGNPENLSVDDFGGQPPSIFDIFINNNPATSNYLQAYQYVNQDGQNKWIKIFTLAQSVISLNKVVEFTTGQGTINLNLQDLGLDDLPFDSDTGSSAYFNVSATISDFEVSLLGNEVAVLADHRPAALSVLVEDVIDDPEPLDPTNIPKILPIRLSAVEFVEGAWSLITERNVLVYLTITFANPNEVLNFEGGE